MGQALLNAALYLNGDVILSAVSRAEMEKYDVLPKHLDGIVNQLRVTKDIKAVSYTHLDVYKRQEMGIDYSRIIDDTFYTKTFAQNKICLLYTSRCV